MATKLPLVLACWDYDRTRALQDGSVQPEGIDLTYLPLGMPESFFRMLHHREFDASEMSLSWYTRTLGFEEPPFIAIPVLPVADVPALVDLRSRWQRDRRSHVS